MATLIGSLTRKAVRQEGGPLNVLTAPTHERYEAGLAKTGHNFYALRGYPHFKDWNVTYAPVPDNYILLNPSRGEKQLPPDVDFDVVLSQHRFGQFQVLSQFAKRLHLPHVCIEHTLPMEQWGPDRLENVRKMRADRNVFISEFSVEKWGWKGDDSVRVVHHGVDTETFSPNDMVCDRRPTLLSVVNDWVNRDWCCGYELWRSATSGLPVTVVGATPGLSEAAKSVPDLVMKYRSSRVFVNTSLISPVPTALLEAMACGCAVVTTGTCMLPEFVRHGENGLIGNTPGELRDHCTLLLKDENLARKLGAAARKTILEKFSMKAFTDNWDAVLREAADITYTGIV